ncbi:Alpha-ketoglutarate-dependent taurine dioxygenase [Variovorax sp. PBS-H4]|uniref:TauD/TfdA dioxygenase family protein n=1 Tax=Variovorax sp. PBS-H4 TaxID=434008 RepID=UPI001315E8A2|nr:TauD/TfdA family dioxygenase [Variovorax sp. PBS-H4]VTU18015.1 Alpha-ketoglutarate-dependent taurine dioxygenase [Variovorax sp. PBS-H4]
MPRISVTKLAPALGAEVSGIDLHLPIDEETLSALKDAWASHLVLRFRGQALTDPQLLAFSRLLGPLDPPGPNPYGKPFLEDFPEINVISNVKVGGAPIGNLGDGEAVWHCDMTYVEAPPRAALLHALEIPSSGGDTFWSNMYTAFETLPDAMKKRIAGLRAIHDATYNSAGVMRKGMSEVTDPRKAPGAQHPLVIKHPDTGRAALYLGRRRNSYVLGLELEESEALLDELWAHASRPEFTFRQVWQQHDLILWDNRCTLHRRDAFDPAARRVMHRTQIKGTPVAPAFEAA